LESSKLTRVTDGLARPITPLFSFSPDPADVMREIVLFSRNLRESDPVNIGFSFRSTPVAARSQPMAHLCHRPPGPECEAMELERIAWILTVLTTLVTALVLLLHGYYGYAGVTLAVAVSAFINLF
jgi:hypothetical protein